MQFISKLFFGSNYTNTKKAESEENNDFVYENINKIDNQKNINNIIIVDKKEKKNVQTKNEGGNNKLKKEESEETDFYCNEKKAVLKGNWVFEDVDDFDYDEFDISFDDVEVERKVTNNVYSDINIFKEDINTKTLDTKSWASSLSLRDNSEVLFVRKLGIEFLVYYVNNNQMNRKEEEMKLSDVANMKIPRINTPLSLANPSSLPQPLRLTPRGTISLDDFNRKSATNYSSFLSPSPMPSKPKTENWDDDFGDDFPVKPRNDDDDDNYNEKFSDSGSESDSEGNEEDDMELDDDEKNEDAEDEDEDDFNFDDDDDDNENDNQNAGNKLQINPNLKLKLPPQILIDEEVDMSGFDD